MVYRSTLGPQLAHLCLTDGVDEQRADVGVDLGQPLVPGVDPGTSASGVGVAAAGLGWDRAPWSTAPVSGWVSRLAPNDDR